jgi:hypothetical protein
VLQGFAYMIHTSMIFDVYVVAHHTVYAEHLASHNWPLFCYMSNDSIFIYTPLLSLQEQWTLLPKPHTRISSCCSMLCCSMR